MLKKIEGVVVRRVALAKALVVAAVLSFTGMAQAAAGDLTIDTSSLTAGFVVIGAAVAAVGAAWFLVPLTIKGFKAVVRAM